MKQEPLWFLKIRQLFGMKYWDILERKGFKLCKLKERGSPDVRRVRRFTRGWVGIDSIVAGEEVYPFFRFHLFPLPLLSIAFPSLFSHFDELSFHPCSRTTVSEATSSVLLTVIVYVL